MTEIKHLEGMFHSELKILWSAENMLVEAMPRMIERATNEGLKNLLRLHLAETDQHKVALEMICKQLGIDPRGESNSTLKEILQAGEEVLSKGAKDEGMDAALIGAAQNIEHYEISAYGSVAHYAEQLGYEGISKRLRLTLGEEQQADTKLNFVAKNLNNFRAQMVEQEV